MNRISSNRSSRVLLAALLLALLAALVLALPGRALADGTQIAHAEDGSATYASVDDAWAAARSGKVIVMDADWDLGSGSIGVPSGENVTLKMNGHKVYRDTSEGGCVIWVYEGASLTLDGSGAQATLEYWGFESGELTTRTLYTVKTGGLVTGGHSRSDGGGIHMDKNATVELINVSVSGNKTYSCDGGGIALSGADCTLKMTDSTVEHNAAEALVANGCGGGIYVGGKRCRIYMVNSSVDYNSSMQSGGGIYSGSGSTYISMKQNSSIDHNIATLYQYGGGLYFNESYFTIEGDGTASISYNHAGSEGGAIVINAVRFGTNEGSISGVTFEGNDSAAAGAIWLCQENVVISDCTFRKNKANNGWGGAISIDNGDNTFKNCTFTDNSSVTGGGAIYSFARGIAYSDCTFTGNTTADEGGAIFTQYDDNVYLGGVMRIYDNYRTDGTPDDLFLDSTSGENIWAYVVAGNGNDVKEGSHIGIRTGNSGTREIVTELSDYIQGTYFLDDTSFYLRYDASDQKLYQEPGSTTYKLTFNGQLLGEYASGTFVSINGRYRVTDDQAFSSWDTQATTGLWNVGEIISDAEDPSVCFAMPRNDVFLVANVVSRVDSVTLVVSDPTPGQALPEQATLTYTPVGGELTRKGVPVSWSKVVDGESVPVSGKAELATTYVATVTAAQDGDAGMAFALGMDETTATLYFSSGYGAESKTASASVDKASGTLTVTSQGYTTRDRKVTSVEAPQMAVLPGSMAADLTAAVPTSVVATTEDGLQVELAVDAAGIDWADCTDAKGAAILGEDGKVAEHDGEETHTYTVAVALSAPQGASLPESLATAQLSVVVGHGARTVTFDPGNGDASWTQSVDWGGKASKPESDPVWEGHTFKGWYAEGSDAAYNFRSDVTEDITLVGMWETDTCTVTFKVDDAVYATQTVARGGVAQAPEENPSKTGSTFKGWYTEGASEPYDFNSAVSGDLTLYAQWSVNMCKVTFFVDGAEYEVQEVAYGSPVTPEKDTPAKAGCAFKGWYAEGSSVAYDLETPVTGDLALHAEWAVQTCMVTFTVDGGAYATQAVEYGSSASAPQTAPTKDGYTFQGWYADEALAQAYDFSTPVTGDLTLYAKWAEAPAPSPSPEPEPEPTPDPDPDPDPAPTSFTDVTLSLIHI